MTATRIIEGLKAQDQQRKALELLQAQMQVEVEPMDDVEPTESGPFVSVLPSQSV